MNRKEYWNEVYTTYWKAATDEADSSGEERSRIKKLSGNDFRVTDTSQITSFLEAIPFVASSRILDFGCGFGRLYPYLSSKGEYYGIDISESMIRECKTSFTEVGNHFITCEGENLEFSDSFFDTVVCYAVFDACYQEVALREMLRVTKLGGCIALSGKNTNYKFDDEEAYIAEINARKKGHPNFFTDYNSMRNQFQKYASIIKEEFIVYRGDASKDIFEYEQPGEYYQWRVIIQKIMDQDKEFEVFSNEFSNTWRRINGER